MGAALLVAGYAWHDALRARLAGAGRWALLLLAPTAAALAFWNAEVEYLAFALGAAPALGWDLRMPRLGDPRPRPVLGLLAGLAYACAIVWAAFAWGPALVQQGFVVCALLVGVRVLLVDPFLAWRARRRSRGSAGKADPPRPATIK